MANAAERVLDAEAAANALVAELARLKTAAESLETAHSDTERAARAAHDVVTTLNDVMPAVARVLEQLQALDLPGLTQRLTGEIRAATEPVNQAAAILEALAAEVAAIQDAQTRIEPALQELDGKAASLLQQAAAAAEHQERASTQVQTSLAKLESLPAEVAAIQDAQAGSERAMAENSQASMTAVESLTQQIAKRDEAQAKELRRLTWKLAGVMIVGLIVLAVVLRLTGIG